MLTDADVINLVHHVYIVDILFALMLTVEFD